MHMKIEEEGEERGELAAWHVQRENMDKKDTEYGKR